MASFLPDLFYIISLLITHVISLVLLKNLNSMEKINIMIAEDHKMFREVIAERISVASNRINIIGVAANGKELLDLIALTPPQIVLLDLNMPEMDGWTVLDFLKKNYPTIKIIIFSGEYSEFRVADAILNGASAFLDKWNSDENNLITAIESVFENGYYFDDFASQEIIIAMNAKKQISFLIDDQKFSETHIKIIQLICEGMQIKEISARLNISDSTVKYHKSNVFKKTESNTNLDILKYAVGKGIFNVSVRKIKPEAGKHRRYT